MRLDGRLSSGTPLDRSHANIALRYVRFSGQAAPVDLSDGWVGRGQWVAGQGGSYGGAFRYEGGSSDHSNPVRLTFVNTIFDHCSASTGGAIFINGRAGHNLPVDSSPQNASLLQNWESGVAATWESCVFFRNFAGGCGGAFVPTPGDVYVSSESEFDVAFPSIYPCFDPICDAFVPGVGSGECLADDVHVQRLSFHSKLCHDACRRTCGS